MNKVFTYLACPYSDKDSAVVENRIKEFLKADAYLTGYHHKLVVSPLSKHFVLKYRTIPSDWGFWEKYSKAMLDTCFEMYVLCLPGWNDSVGVQGELEYADKLGIQIHMLNPVEYLAEVSHD